jgi:hypothetical protein
VKAQGLLHLTNYLAHPLMIILLLTAIPLIPVRSPCLAYLTCLSVASVGPPIMYALSQWAITPHWTRRLARLPWLALLGTGIALNNALAIAEGLTGRESSFQRTPKFRIEGLSDRWADKSYALPFSPMALGELALALYAAWGIRIALAWGRPFIIPYLALYALGFGYVSLLTIAHSMPRRGLRRAVRLRLEAGSRWRVGLWRDLLP